MRKLLVNVDGGSRGNPGEAAIGAVVTDEEGTTVEEISRSIGKATNNVAEYKALIAGIKAALEYAPQEVIFFTDSQLIANQINGVYRVREPHLQNLKDKTVSLLERFPSWTVRFVERGANWKAHRLCQGPLQEQDEQKEDITSKLKKKIDKLSVENKEKVLEFVNDLSGEF